MSEDHSVTLRDHIESRLCALEKATTLAAQQMDRRLDGMNEFRLALKDQTGSLVSVAEYRADMKSIREDIRLLREAKAVMDGKASQLSVNVTQAIAIVAVIVGLINVIHNAIK